MEAVILDVVCGLGFNVLKQKKVIYLLVMAGAFLATFVFGISVMYIILAATVIGIYTIPPQSTRITCRDVGIIDDCA